LAKNLVIVESPAKARTLNKFLGKEFMVEACGGHIRDLPPKSLGINIEKDFQPNYQIIKGKEKIVKLLKEKAAGADKVYLAPDPDREGEAIAWHLEVLLSKKGNIKRIEFHEITKPAVIDAIKHPRDIDMARVDAQQARRILDRLVGYKLSPLLWKKIRKGLSAGRVQSVAVRLICEREDEITKFKSEEYWDITAELTDAAGPSFRAALAAKEESPLGVRPGEKGEVIRSEATAQTISQELAAAAFVIKDIRKKEQKRYPSPPFITSTLQQEAARKLGFSARRTMAVAQKLYEGIEIKGEGHVGLITYMRTDSVRIAQEAENDVRKYITETFGAPYLPEAPIRYKKKKQAQDAHEAIRPTSVFRLPENLNASLKPDEIKLYDLIFKRFVACQMKAAIFYQTAVDISAAPYLLRAHGSVLKFEGYSKVYEESRDEAEESGSSLPELKVGEKLKLLQILPQQHFTQPPPRYNEASLIKELEKRGIGRPSTYAPIITTIQERGYVEKSGRALKPTEIGMVTNGLLVKHFPKILDFKFTAQMEDELDDILTHKANWIAVLRKFYEPFQKSLAEAEVKMEKVKKEIMTEEPCPTCGSKLVIRSGRYGDFLACSNYPKCKFTKDLEKEKSAANAVQEACEKCGKVMVLKHGRFGDFLACSGYPQCKNIKSILKKIGVKCPKCNGELVERRTKRGKIFFSCSNYPGCDFATWQKPPAQPTPEGEQNDQRLPD
jgi:DNA topoisomerase-1